MGRFLVVDDDARVGRQLARVVRPFGEAVVAGSVSGAMALLDAHVAWRGFIVDLGLPDGSGLDVVTKARTAFPGVRAMVLTGHVEPKLINAVHDLGATYVVKPVDAARIKRFCQEIVEATTVDLTSAVLPGTLEGCVERLRELLPLRVDPLARYAIGAIVAAIKAGPEVYGKSGVTTVAQAIGEDVPSLYRHAAVAECWTEAGVRNLLGKKGRDGRPLSWSHLVQLEAVQSPVTRQRLVKQALDEALSVRDLTALVKGEAAGASSDGAEVEP
jgi:ActR/RegA family two-component response regulator